jgi:SSS family solute:Na+ symporter
MEYAIWFIVAFLLMLTGLGVWHTRRIRTGEDFALAGRRLGPGILIGTLVATWIGTGSIFGSTEKAYEIGIVALFLPLGGAIGIVVLSFLAPRVREMPADSLPEILRIRFGRAAQLIGAIALIGAYMIIVSYQYRAGAAVGDELFPDLPTIAGHNIMPVAFALFVILYTMLAGMVSVAWTDLINGILMAVGLIAALVILAMNYDAAAKPIEAIQAIQDADPAPGGLAWIGFLLPPFLLVMGDANLHQRFMSATSPRTARLSAIGMFFGVVVLEWTIIIIALMSRSMLTEAPDNHAHAVIDTAFNLVPPVVGITLAATIVAVIITTADSYLLGSATSVATDLTGGLTTPWKQRIIVVVIGLTALGLSYTSDEFFNVAIYAYTLYGATLTPALLCALFYPRTHQLAVVGGMAAGLLVALAWKFGPMALAAMGIDLPAMPGFIADLDPVLPALVANVLLMVILARILPTRPDVKQA